MSRPAVTPVADLSPDQVRSLRLASLLLRPHPAGPEATSVAEVVTWLGALQAQDHGSGLWSLGVRLPHLDQAGVEAALERREALRTWPMRGTVHLVPARDARWMVQILGERPLAQAEHRRKQIGLDAATADRAVEVIGEALAGGGRLTRAQVLERLTASGLSVSGQLGYHLLWYASQHAVSCIAPHVDGEQTFVLLDEWAPDPWLPEREEALATIAARFVRGHGPVPLKDFVGWTGLTAADARLAVAGAGEEIVTVTCDGVPMLVSAQLLDSPTAADTAADDATAGSPVALLPGFDEFVLGYKDRSLLMTPEQFQVVVPGGNGIFQPTVVRDGRVAGTWKRKKLTARSRLEVALFDDAVRDGVLDAGLAAAADGYARYLGQPVELRVG
ncbi:MAG: winged helix DNA-binding domain-containing protein [Kineosporiaceae bacterium]